MSARDDAFKEGMWMRRDNVTESELIFRTREAHALGPSTTLLVVEGWKFMDRLILGPDMLEGRA